MIDEFLKLSDDFLKLVPKKKEKPVDLRRNVTAIDLKDLTELLEIELKQAEIELQSLAKKIKSAGETNHIVDRFDALDQFRIADEAVKSIYAEMKQAYASVVTGVDGMILVYEPDKQRILFSYDGRCFENTKIEQRFLSDYSQTQKSFIASMLQLHLLKQKANPLNILFTDSTPLDSQTEKLFTDFAKEHGLLIITTQTGNYTQENLEDNEILVENGHLIFLDNVEDFSDAELAILLKDNSQEKAETSTEAKGKKGKGKVSPVMNMDFTPKVENGKPIQKTLLEEIEEKEKEKDITNPMDEL